MTTHEIVLTRYRDSVETPPSEFLEVRPAGAHELTDGEVRVRNTHLQIAAVVADRMAEDPGLPIPGFTPGSALRGGAVGEVIESRNAELPVGTVVQHDAGFAEESVLGTDEAFAVPRGVFPGPEYVLTQGVTAYHGMVDVAEVGEGDVVFVTGAAGGVGSLAGQIANCRGAAVVIGSAGGPDKCAYLVDELGFDLAIDYRNEDVLGRLRELAPEGIDVFFDNVGGTQFEAAVLAAGEHARFALCGALAAQVGGPDGHPRLDILAAILHEIRLRPFRTLHTPERVRTWMEAYARWFAAGQIVFPHTVVTSGLDGAMHALDDLLAGRHRGNLIVRLEH